MLGQISVFTILLLGVSTVRSQLHLEGSCPAVKVVGNLDIDKYVGEWYEQYVYTSSYGYGSKCNTAHYVNNKNGSLTITLNGVSASGNKPTSVTGTATIVKSGVFSVSFSSLKVESPNMYVLDTDYDSINVIFSCVNRASGHDAYLWILTRQRQPTQDVLHAVEKVLADNNISKSYLNKVDQINCSN